MGLPKAIIMQKWHREGYLGILDKYYNLRDFNGAGNDVSILLSVIDMNQCGQDIILHTKVILLIVTDSLLYLSYGLSMEALILIPETLL